MMKTWNPNEVISELKARAETAENELGSLRAAVSESLDVLTGESWDTLAGALRKAGLDPATLEEGQGGQEVRKAWKTFYVGSCFGCPANHDWHCRLAGRKLPGDNHNTKAPEWCPIRRGRVKLMIDECYSSELVLEEG